MKIFANNQRKRLLQLGLIDKQIDALDDMVYVLCSWVNSDPPTMAEVKKPLQDLLTQLTAANETIKRLKRQRMADDALMTAAFNRKIYPDELDSFFSRFDSIAQCCTSALKQLPKQKRSDDAHCFPVARIWETMVRTHGTEKPMTIALSSSPTSPFREIVCICYEVMTGKIDIDPERAIKKYIKEARAHNQAQRDKSKRFKLEVREELLIPTKPRRIGRQVKKKTGLAS